jgi:hypothetical protein
VNNSLLSELYELGWYCQASLINMKNNEITICLKNEGLPHMEIRLELDPTYTVSHHCISIFDLRIDARNSMCTWDRVWISPTILHNRARKQYEKEL